jgi:uncharacterized membrane protein YhaH (DUF805 family)
MNNPVASPPEPLVLNNPYSAPGADLSLPGAIDETYQPRLFSLHGRIGRIRYVAYLMGGTLLAMLAAIALLVPIGMASNNNFLSAFVPLLSSIGMLVATFVLAIRRLHDTNRSGWLSILTLVPIVNLGLALWLLFGPGTQGANQYGPAPAKNSDGVLAMFAVTMAMGACMVVFVAISAYGIYKLNSAGLFGTPPASERRPP